jgi:uncharacterized NAD(P)/FAD-binding protein YdhS
MKRITIIGGGASGTLLAVNLIKHAGEEPLEINLVEKHRTIGRGVAYSTVEDIHLLNVPAAKMGAFPDDIEHFHRWLGEMEYDYAPGDFVPRKIYGEYLREVFSEVAADRSRNVSINLLDDEAIDVLTDDDSALVLLRSGEALPSHRVVLAFGNFLPPDPPTETRDFTAAPKYFQNAWDTTIHDQISPEDHILVIGTGLTAVDNILSFYHKGHKGKITALSTHGWFPMVHQAAEPYPSFKDEIYEERNIRRIFKSIRRHCKVADNWRAVIDSLRPFTQDVWYNLPVEEKQRFMRRLRRIWDISRHRIPPKCNDILRSMQAAGSLEVRRGRLRDITPAGDTFEIKYRTKGAENTLAVDAVINCTGSESNFTKIDFPLVRSLIEKGEISPDELFLGLNATPDGKIISRSNEISNVISTLGTSLKGVLWESTAMPEIRAQARNLALKLLAEPGG